MENNNNQLIIFGRNAVSEALKAKHSVNTLYILKDSKHTELIAAAKQAGAVIKEVTAEKLNKLADASGVERHGGIALALASIEYATVEEMLIDSPFIMIADEIEDPHNLGALIRTAEAAGVNGLIIPKRRSAAISGAVYAASAGAAAHLKIARVTNITDTIKALKKHNIWIYGAEADGEDYQSVSFGNGGVCLIIGSEGKGLSRLVRENCDFVISLPMYGKINSLNASVSGGILMYEIAKQRNSFQKKGGG